MLDESNHKPKKIRADQGSEFYNRSMKSRQKNHIEPTPNHNKWKSVIVERFMKTLKEQIYKYMIVLITYWFITT